MKKQKARLREIKNQIDSVYITSQNVRKTN